MPKSKSKHFKHNSDKDRKQLFEESVIKCYFDGACNNNPVGDMGYGAIVMKDNVCTPLFDGKKVSIENSNNLAEYLAFELVLDNLEGTKNRNIQVYGDSDLVVKQMNGQWRIKDGKYYDVGLRCLRKLMKLEESNTISISWIPRELNTDADELSREGLKKAKGIIC